MLPLDVNVSDIDESSNITAKPKNNSQQTHYGGGEGGRRRGERERDRGMHTDHAFGWSLAMGGLKQ